MGDERDETTKNLKENALQRGVPMVEVLEALEDEHPKTALKNLILSKEAYTWTDNGKTTYTPQPDWLPGTVTPTSKVKPEQRFSLWRNGQFGTALNNELIAPLAEQKEQEIDLYVCCQVTALVQNKIMNLKPRSTKLALPPHNSEILYKNGSLASFGNGKHKLGNVTVKLVDIPCYGPKLTEVIFELLNLDVVVQFASELRFMIPNTRMINETVRSKCAKKGMEFVSKLREDAENANYESAVKKLEDFIHRVERVAPSDFVNKRYEAHEYGNEWLKDHLKKDWRDKLDVHEFLQNFGFEEQFIETKLGSKTIHFNDKPKEEQDAVTAVKWMVKAADIFQFLGSMADVVNLVFCMLRHPATSDSDPVDGDPGPATVTIDEVIKVVSEFKDIVENGYWHRLEWVPNYMIQDSQMDDMVAWVLLHLVCSKKNQELVCLVQLPDKTAVEEAAKRKAKDNAVAQKKNAGEQTAKRDELMKTKLAHLKAELKKMTLAQVKDGARDEGFDESTINDVDDNDNPKEALINQMLANAREAPQMSNSMLDVEGLQKILARKHKDQLGHLQDQYESRSTLRNTVVPFLDPDSKNLDQVSSSACLLPPQTIYIVSEYEMRAFTGKYTWNGKMFESGRKCMLLHPMTGHWCFSLDVAGMSDVDKYFQIKARTMLGMPHNTLGWDFVVQAENRHSQLRVRGKEKEPRLHWEELLTEITIDGFEDISLGVLRWSNVPDNNKVLISWQTDEASWWNTDQKRWANRHVDLPKTKYDFESLWPATEDDIEKLWPVPDQRGTQGTRKSLKIGGATKAGPSTVSPERLAPRESGSMAELGGTIPDALNQTARANGIEEATLDAVDGADAYVFPSGTPAENTHDEMSLKALKEFARECGCDKKAVEDTNFAEDPKKAVIKLIVGKKKVEAVHQPSLLDELHGTRLGDLKKTALNIGCDAQAVDVDGEDNPKQAVINLIVAKKEAKFPVGQRVVSLKSKSDCEPPLSMTDVGNIIKVDFAFADPIQVDFGEGLRKWLKEADLAILKPIDDRVPRHPHKDSCAIVKSLNEAGDLIDASGYPTPLPSKPIFDVWIPPARSPDKLPPCRFWVVDEENNKRWQCGLNASCDSFTRCLDHARIKENQMPEKMFECPVYKSALAFLNELEVDIWIDHKWDRCYCSNCYEENEPDMISPDRFDYQQIAPRGWVGFGVVNSQDLRPETKKNSEKWPIRFHGCNPNNLKNILRFGNLARPGDRLVHNKVMMSSLREGNHSVEPIFYTSPTIAYSGLQFYARPKRIEAMRGKVGPNVGQVVLQCNQKRVSTSVDHIITKGDETMGFRAVNFPELGVCKHTSLYEQGRNGIETIRKEPDGCAIRRVMIRTFEEETPPTSNTVLDDFMKNRASIFNEYIKNGRRQDLWLQEPVKIPETFRSPNDRPQGFKEEDGTLWL